MKVRRVVTMSAVIAAMMLANTVEAVTPTIWKQDTQGAFGKGEADSVSITRDGEVRLGPTLTEFGDTGEEFGWSIAQDSQDRIYVGTGSEGRVYRLSGGTSTLLFDSPERAIFALTVAKDGTVYAGSSPGGLIYAIPPKGEPRTFARTDDQHVWVLIADDRGGLLAGTGGQAGRVLEVSSSGEVMELLKTTDPNVTSLIQNSNGTIYAGTDQSGFIYRIEGGESDVLYDAAEAEVKALAIAPDGRLLAGVMNSSGPSAKHPPAVPNGPGRDRKKLVGQSVIYTIRPSGSGWRLWDVPAPSVQALSMNGDGSVTVVTGGKGQIFKLYTDGTHSLLTTVDEAQPWAFQPDGKGGGWVASSGSGQVFRLGSTLAQKGSLTSEPKDFSLVTRWGRLDWEGESPNGTSVSFESRAGNSEIPDDTWSGWVKVLAGEFAMRDARYAQYRMTLSGNGKQSPSVRSVTVSGLPENVEPIVIDLAIRGPHEASGGNDSGGKNVGRHTPPPNEGKDGWEITWTGADVNNDDLIYSLHFKGRKEKTWKLLEKELNGNKYLWDTESAPEGNVLIRLTVSDVPSNPEDLALSSKRVSAPFVIDHTEPVVRIDAVEVSGNGTVAVKASITDATSAVKSASYSLNSGKWKIVFPLDRIFDSKDESVSLNLSGLSSSEYTLVIRASDTRGNVGVAKQVFDFK